MPTWVLSNPIIVLGSSTKFNFVNFAVVSDKDTFPGTLLLGALKGIEEVRGGPLSSGPLSPLPLSFSTSPLLRNDMADAIFENGSLLYSVVLCTSSLNHPGSSTASNVVFVLSATITHFHALYPVWCQKPAIAIAAIAPEKSTIGQKLAVR